MRVMNYLVLAGVVVSLSACAFRHGPLVLRTIGPAPLEVPVPGTDGYLVVYSAWDVNSNFDRHTSYIVASDDGKQDQPIQNQANIFDQRPAQVGLPPGTYRVIVSSENFGRLSVPVLIRKGETTVVYLDSNTQPAAAKSGDTNLVRLPDGSVMGWATNAIGR